MTKSMTITRRQVFQQGLSLATTAALIRPAMAAKLAVTPYQTPGPFYPRSLPLDQDNDLVQVKGHVKNANGVVTHIFGRVLDRMGNQLPGIRVEIWQCDALGRYHHPRDGGGADPDFQGFGHTVTGEDGAYRFRTIKPVPYPGRAPHIHFAVSGNGVQPMTTQMYVRGEPLNHRDVVLNRVRDAEARQSLITFLRTASDLEPNALAGTFDIVVE